MFKLRVLLGKMRRFLLPSAHHLNLIAPRKSRFSSACYLRYNIQMLKGSVTFSAIFLKLGLYAFACRGCRDVILLQTGKIEYILF